MAVDTEDNQTTDETQQNPQPPDQTDSERQDQPSTEEVTTDENPSNSELTDEIADTYDSNQPETDIAEIEAVLSDAQTNEQPENLKRILNMKVPIIVRIAKKKMKVGEAIKLNIGTVIQFEQDAYQYIDLLVNNEIIGLGQPVKVGENFGLKLTQLGDITHTIKSLGQASNEETL